MTKRQRFIILATGVALAALLLIVSVTSVVQKIGKTEVNIIIAPNDATLTIDGQQAKPGKTYLSNGQHTLVASRPPLSDAIQKIDTKNLTDGQDVVLIPDAKTDEAHKWLDGNTAVGDQLQAAGDKQASIDQIQVRKQYPYIDNLPHESIDYKVDYSMDADKNISFQVTLQPYELTTNPDYKQQLKDFKAEAISWMKDQHIDVDHVPITFTPDPNK